ncbi:MAG: hypothetical protein ACXVB9_10615 [Bdellovibrionota bacterium]
MKNKICSYCVLFSLFTTLAACSNAKGDSPQALGTSNSDSASLLKVDNLANDQRITLNVPTQFRISADPQIDSVIVSANGHQLGKADAARIESKKFRFQHTFGAAGDQDITFAGFKGKTPVSTASFRVHVMSSDTPAPSHLFNAYVLKAVDYLNQNYGLLGYNINSQNTHDIPYYTYGTFKPTGNGLTMCVAGSLEVIMTAFDIYAKETGNTSIYDFLPFRSWNSLAPDTIKGQIWVDPKLHSAGTGDAITHFGIGERVKFKDLQPGGFININRTTGSGHSVTFLSFIDIKGNDVAEYNDTVVGFRYFGAQGHKEKGQGGLSFRHAFFSKYGCPDVPYQRDCNVLLSDDPHILNVGEILDPKEWKHPSAAQMVDYRLESSTPIRSPVDFDGLTTDD